MATCSDGLAQGVMDLGRRADVTSAKGVLQAVGEPVQRPRYIVSGWACRLCQMADGRRQLFDLLLPGDGIGIFPQDKPLAMTGAMALTDVETVNAASLFDAQQHQGSPEFVDYLWAAAREQERRYLGQVLRLGRLTAVERLAHFLVETHDRMAVIGQAAGGRFPLPLTQEILADLLGLSTVHFNRTLQELRRRGLVNVGGGFASICDFSGLCALVDRTD